MVLQFLADAKTRPTTIRAIQARMEKEVNEVGLLQPEKLIEVMGDEELARDFEKAWGEGKIFASAWK